MSPLEIATLTIAAAGLLLGLRSEWRAWRQDTIRGRVVPKISYPVGPVLEADTKLAIEVVNHSAFPVTIDEVGFRVRGDKNRYAVTVPIIVDGRPWPRRLEPRDSVFAHIKVDTHLAGLLLRIRDAYASAATGESFFGTSQALQMITRHGQIPAFDRSRSSGGLPGFVNVSEVDPRSFER